MSVNLHNYCYAIRNIYYCPDSVKRFGSYERDHWWHIRRTDRRNAGIYCLQRIWGLIIEVINVIAEFISCNPFELTENVINNNH